MPKSAALNAAAFWKKFLRVLLIGASGKSLRKSIRWTRKGCTRLLTPGADARVRGGDRFE
jgi:hypothetical protein